MDVSRFFTLAELTRSETAVRENIVNQPGDTELAQLRALCTQVLDPLRVALARPIKVSSGYRSPALNRRIGGAAKSQHVAGQAADIQVAGSSVLEALQSSSGRVGARLPLYLPALPELVEGIWRNLAGSKQLLNRAEPIRRKRLDRHRRGLFQCQCSQHPADRRRKLEAVSGARGSIVHARDTS